MVILFFERWWSMKNKIIFAILLGVFLTSGQAFAFLFDQGPATNASVKLAMSGETSWTEAGAAEVALTTNIENTVDSVFSGEFRVLVMVMNGTMDFDKVDVTRLGDKKLQANGFLSEPLELTSKGKAALKYQIRLPDASKGKIIQVMAIIFGRASGDAPPPIISRAIYQLPQ